MLPLPQANAYIGSKLIYENDTLADRNSKSTQDVQNILYFLGGVLKKTTMFIEEPVFGKAGGRCHLQKLSLIPSSGTVSIWALQLAHV